MGKLRAKEFVADVLAAAGADAQEIDRLVRAMRKKFDFRNARPGHRYRVEVSASGSIKRFLYQANPREVIEVARKGDDFTVQTKPIALDREVIEVVGEIKSSLYEAFTAAGESTNLAMKLAEAFKYDIDFFHDTRKGDTFRIFVEKYSTKGTFVRYGKVIAAEYKGSAGSPIGTRRLYRYENKKAGINGFYDEKGTAAQRAFLKSPLSFTRVSSPYGYRRHPILGRRHFHGGVDYAAPRGTPVMSVSGGTVTFAGRKGANGNMVKIRHASGYESFYLHLSRVMVRSGQRVSQSSVIGKVGSTGRSTGPHLDFRLKKNGRYINPRRQVVPRKKTIPRRHKKHFRNEIERWRGHFEKEQMLASN